MRSVSPELGVKREERQLLLGKHRDIGRGKHQALLAFGMLSHEQMHALELAGRPAFHLEGHDPVLVINEHVVHLRGAATRRP